MRSKFGLNFCSNILCFHKNVKITTSPVHGRNRRGESGNDDECKGEDEEETEERRRKKGGRRGRNGRGRGTEESEEEKERVDEKE